MASKPTNSSLRTKPWSKITRPILVHDLMFPNKLLKRVQPGGILREITHFNVAPSIDFKLKFGEFNQILNDSDMVVNNDDSISIFYVNPLHALKQIESFAHLSTHAMTMNSSLLRDSLMKFLNDHSQNEDPVMIGVTREKVVFFVGQVKSRSYSSQVFCIFTPHNAADHDDGAQEFFRQVAQATVALPQDDEDDDEGDDFFAPRSPEEAEGGEVDDDDIAAVALANEQRFQRRSRLIWVYRETQEEVNRLYAITLRESFGYYTFALEFERAEGELGHVGWPSWPTYRGTIYYTEGDEALDPLVMAWDDFEDQLAYVIMHNNLQNQYAILLQLRVGIGNVVRVGDIPKVTLQGQQLRLAQAVYYYCATYNRFEPYFPIPRLNPWQNANLLYYAADGSILEPPRITPGDDYEEEAEAEHEETEEEQWRKFIDKVSLIIVEPFNL